MATFHPFPRPPFELRAQIWESTVEPRTVMVRYAKEKGTHDILHATSSTPVPAILQACHEARNQGLYQRAFSLGQTPRYVYVNFEIDFVSVGSSDFDEFTPERLLIRRLLFEYDCDLFVTQYMYNETLGQFSNMQEIHIICDEDLFEWLEPWETMPWPCPKENIRFIDGETGDVVDGYKLREMWKDKLEVARESQRQYELDCSNELNYMYGCDYGNGHGWEI